MNLKTVVSDPDGPQQWVSIYEATPGNPRGEWHLVAIVTVEAGRVGFTVNHSDHPEHAEVERH